MLQYIEWIPQVFAVEDVTGRGSDYANNGAGRKDHGKERQLDVLAPG
jgi:hypothetical protein